MSVIRLANGDLVNPDAGDWADREVNYGGYRAYNFSPKWPHNGTPLPRRPRPAGGTCLCQACSSEGYYATSPVCRYWRVGCEVCAGERDYLSWDTGRPVRVPCELCQDLWTEDVRWFLYAIEHSQAAARRLREKATANAAAERARIEARWGPVLTDPTATPLAKETARQLLGAQTTRRTS